MEKARQIVSLISPFIPLKPMIQLSGQKLIFPLYHAVSDNSPAHLKHLYNIRSEKEFEEDIDELCRFYEPLSPEILRAPGKLKRRTKPGFILSFDDGLREIKEIVEPILSRKGINAIFFLNNAFIDNRAMFFRYKASVLIEILLNSTEHSLPETEIAGILGIGVYEKNKVISEILKTGYLHKSKLDALADITAFDITRYLAEVKPYLTAPEILELQKKGFHIGAHSYDHPLFTDLNEEQMKFEVTASLEDLELRFQPEMKFFAFPFTDGGISSRVINAVFQNHPDAIFGSAGIKREKQAFHFQRIPFEKSKQSVVNYLKTEYLYYVLKAGIGRNFIKR
jgi:peptidoglycan/xylan/chitin deacetylase (PgdA/CDA1 family)